MTTQSEERVGEGEAARPNYLKQGLVGGTLVFTTVFVLPQLVVFGLLVRHLRRNARDEPYRSFLAVPYVDDEGRPVRKREEWARILGDGVRAAVLWAVLFAPLAFVATLYVFSAPGVFTDLSAVGTSRHVRVLLMGLFVGGWVGILIYYLSLYLLLSLLLALGGGLRYLLEVVRDGGVARAGFFPVEVLGELFTPSLQSVTFWLLFLLASYVLPAALTGLAVAERPRVREGFGPAVRTIVGDGRYALAWARSAVVLLGGLVAQSFGIGAWLYLWDSAWTTFVGPRVAGGLLVASFVAGSGVYFVCLVSAYGRLGRAGGVALGLRPDSANSPVAQPDD